MPSQTMQPQVETRSSPLEQRPENQVINPISLKDTALSPQLRDLAIARTTNELASEAEQSNLNRNVLRVTQSVAQYDVSSKNPTSLANLGKAIAGCIDRDDLTFLDPETKQEKPIGDVLVAVDISDPERIILSHRDSAGKGALGRVVQSLRYCFENPLHTIGMKLLGVVADPEVIYKQKVVQVLAQLDREGLFGPPGVSTFNIEDWAVSTRRAWRDVVIAKRN